MAVFSGSNRKFAGIFVSLLFIAGGLPATGCGENGSGEPYTNFSAGPCPDGSSGEETPPPGKESVRLAWNPNTEDNLAGYRLYRSRISGRHVKGVYRAEIPAGPGDFKTFTTEKPSSGFHFWVVTAYDIHLNESDFSNEVAVAAE